MDEQHILIDKNQDTFETWAYIEIMGHSQIAGRVSEKKFGVNVMLQIDVPKGEIDFSHSELLSPSSIFRIRPTTEHWCRKYVASRQSYPILPYIPEQKQLVEDASGEDDNSFDSYLKDNE